MRRLTITESQKNDYVKASKAITYDKDTGTFTNNFGDDVTQPSKKGYKVIAAAKGRVIRADRLAVFIVTGKHPQDVVHLNGKLKDNTFENLEPVWRETPSIVRID
jgi:hypothetical protein